MLQVTYFPSKSYELYPLVAPSPNSSPTGCQSILYRSTPSHPLICIKLLLRSICSIVNPLVIKLIVSQVILCITPTLYSHYECTLVTTRKASSISLQSPISQHRYNYIFTIPLSSFLSDDYCLHECSLREQSRTPDYHRLTNLLANNVPSKYFMSPSL